MNSAIKLLALTLILSSCTQMEEYYPDATKTVIDGEEFVVRQQGEGNYLAVPNDPSKYNFASTDARAAPKNVRAIEQVTGCPVLRESIQNRGLNTIAAVSC